MSRIRPRNAGPCRDVGAMGFGASIFGVCPELGSYRRMLRVLAPDSDLVSDPGVRPEEAAPRNPSPSGIGPQPSGGGRGQGPFGVGPFGPGLQNSGNSVQKPGGKSGSKPVVSTNDNGLFSAYVYRFQLCGVEQTSIDRVRFREPAGSDLIRPRLRIIQPGFTIAEQPSEPLLGISATLHSSPPRTGRSRSDRSRLPAGLNTTRTDPMASSP